MKSKIILLLFGAIILSCSGLRQFEKRDNDGRVKKLENYYGNFLKSEENYSYSGDSKNPSKIVYKARRNGKLVPVKEERYIFRGSHLLKLSFYKYTSDGKKLSGQILYSYRNDLLSRIEYYKKDNRTRRLHIIVQDRYQYKKRNLLKRRFIEYTLNPATRQPMQVGQYVIRYRAKKPVSMKTWVMKDNKLISTTISDSARISKKISLLEKYYLAQSKDENLK